MPYTTYLRKQCRYLFPGLLYLLFTLSSCGSTEQVQTIQSAQNMSTQTTQTQSSTPAYSFNTLFTTDGLTVTLQGFICSTNLGRPDNLVLETDKLTYDTGTVQVMQNYLQLLEEHDLILGMPDAWTPPVPPKGLRWLPGGTSCSGGYTIVNKTSSTIQVSRAGFELTAPSEINTNHYHHVSYCVNCSQSGGKPPCEILASVSLDVGGNGARFDSPLASTDPTQCPMPLTIEPGGSREINITITDAHTRDRIYTGEPTLTITTNTGSHVIPLTGLATKLYFTYTNQLPCYQLQGDTFVQDDYVKDPKADIGCPSSNK